MLKKSYKAKANKKTVYGVLIAAAVIVAAVIIYINVAAAGSRKADDAIAKADMEQNDPIATSSLCRGCQSRVTRAATALKQRWHTCLSTMANMKKPSNILDDADIKDDIVAAGVYSQRTAM